MALTYTGNAASTTLLTAWRQNKPPSWNKSYAGEMDTCTLTWQGPQWLEKTFITAQTKFQTLTYIDEIGVTTNDTGMFLIKLSSDDNPIFPTVTLTYEGCRNGLIPDAVPTDDTVLQSASTTKTITDGTSVNFDKAITLNIQYFARRTSYEWVQLTNPSGTVPTAYASARNAITYTLGGSNIILTQFTGMVDAEGLASNTIPTGDATAVWNTFVLTNQPTGFQSKEVVPGKLWQCSSTVDKILIGT